MSVMISRLSAARSFATAAAHAPSAALQELPNGLRVAVANISKARRSSAALVLELGSRHDKLETSGITSLLARALCNHVTLNKDLRRAGARLEARVTRDETALVVDAPDADRAVALLAAVVTQDLTSAQLETARQQLLAEQKARDLDAGHVALENALKVGFQGTRLELPILGLSESVRQMSLEALAQHRDQHVVGPRGALAVVGAKEPSSAEIFARIPRASASGAVPPKESARFTGSDIRVRDDALPLAHVVLCVEGPARASPDFLALQLCHELVGRWEASFGGGADVSSYLGVCSSIERVTHGFSSLLIGFKETSLFGARMAVERMKLEDAAHHVTLEWKRFATELTDNELARAKNALLTNAARGRETSAGRAIKDARALLRSGHVESLGELEARVLAVRASSVRAAAEKYIWDRCPVVSAVGPIEQLEDYEVLRNKFYWLRY